MKPLLLVIGWLLVTGTLCHAGSVTLAWDYLPSLQRQARFLLHIVTLRAGRPTQEDRPLTFTWTSIAGSAVAGPPGSAVGPLNPEVQTGLPFCDMFTTDIVG